MNKIDILLLILFAVLLGANVLILHRQKKRGRGGCLGCPYASCCHKEDTCKKKPKKNKDS